MVAALGDRMTRDLTDCPHLRELRAPVERQESTQEAPRPRRRGGMTLAEQAQLRADLDAAAGLMGRRPDAAIAAIVGCHWGTVGKYRRARGIAAYRRGAK